MGNEVPAAANRCSCLRRNDAGLVVDSEASDGEAAGDLDINTESHRLDRLRPLGRALVATPYGSEVRIFLRLGPSLREEKPGGPLHARY